MPECPACMAQAKPELVEKWKEYELYLCPACDLVFSSPMKGPGREWYEQSPLYGMTRSRVVKKGKFTFPEWNYQQFLKEGRLYGQKLLDVGCGTGVFLSKAQSIGYEVTGIDFDRRSISLARESFGLDNVYALSLEEFTNLTPAKKYDVVTFFEVLEHIENPRRFLQLIKEVLKPGGYIALSVPNRTRTLDTIGIEDYPPHHLTRWSAESLRHFLENNGFEVKKLVVKELDWKDVAGFYP